jgi:hypothetical protein
VRECGGLKIRASETGSGTHAMDFGVFFFKISRCDESTKMLGVVTIKALCQKKRSVGSCVNGAHLSGLFSATLGSR